MSSGGGFSANTVAGAPAESVEHPPTLRALQDLVSLQETETLVPVGSGTQLQLGTQPEGPFRLVELKTALAGSMRHEPEDMVLDVPASATLGEIDQRLSASGQFLPIDPPLAPDATIGGVLAAGGGGPLRTRFGLPRELVLGMSCLRSDGEIVRAGGRVVKNVTGYDMMRLWCGSLGTLGLITKATLRVVPRPEAVDLIAEHPSLETAMDRAAAALSADLRPLAFEILAPKADGEAWVSMARLESGVADAAVDVLPDSRLDETDDIYHECRDLGFLEGDDLTLRVAAPFSHIPAAVAALIELQPAKLVVRPLAGLVRATWGHQLPAASDIAGTTAVVRGRLSAVGGSIIVERQPDHLREVLDVWGEPGSSLPLMRRMKATYDPRARFNRGRFVGGI